MNWSDLNVWAYGIISALGGAIVVLVRKVLTSEKQIELLKQEMTFRKERDDEVKEQLDAMQDDIKYLIRKQ